MKPRNLIESFNVAIEGFLYALRTQVHLKVHVLAAVVVIVAGIFFPLDRMEKLILVLTISMVIMVEMINTAIEKAVDMITEEYHPIAAVAKNVSAGAVLISAIAAAIVGYVIFVDHLSGFIHWPVIKLTQSPPIITLVTLVLVIVIVIIGKNHYKRGSFLKGGMPSGHAALSFALGTAVILLTDKHARPLVALLTVLICVLVAESRVESGTHTVMEVLAGALIGVLSAVLIFQILI